MPRYEDSPNRNMWINLEGKKTLILMRDIDSSTYHDVMDYNQQMKYDNWSTSGNNQVHPSMVEHVQFRKKQAADVADQTRKT